jgi:hypothetical protein
MGPMIIPSTKPRNPFGVGTGMAKAGTHDKSTKIQRNLDNQAVRNFVKKVVSPDGSDDFTL